MKPTPLICLLATALAFAAGDVDEDRVLREAANGDNWFLKGGGFRGDHYSPLSDINTGNVDDLGLAWSTDIPVPDGISATPIVVDGVIYLSAAWSMVFAIDARTGEILWRYNPDVRAYLKNDPGMSWLGRINRGVAVWHGTVFATTADCRLIALDAGSGKPLWTQQTCDPEQGYGISDSPYVGGDLVFVGNAGSESGERNRGYVSAYDAATGELRWRFYTVPSSNPEENTTPAMKMAAATWHGDALQRFGGGGSNWNEMTYDPDTGLLLFGTAGTLPYVYKDRSPDGGDNLFTSSVVAVDAKTGTYAWHYQTVPKDSWEYNATMNIVLAELTFDGESRKVAMIAPKNGFHYVLDRQTGELLDAGKIAKVNWATHINLETGRPVYDPAAEFWNNAGGHGEVWPNMWGAHSWNPMAYSPRQKLVYIPVVDIPSVTSDYADGDFEDSLELRTEVDGEPFAPGKLLAWDPQSGKARWLVEYALPFNGGVLATGGDLVFHGDAFGRFNTYHAATGERLWSVNTGSAISAAAASYRVDKQQYVVVPVGGGGGLQFVYPELHAGDGVRGPVRLMAFSLDAREAMPPSYGDTRLLPDQPPLEATDEELTWGRASYNGWCKGCHGKDAVTRFGGTVPDLRFASAATHENWNDIVIGGSRASYGMPSFDMGKDEAELIRRYVLSRSYQLRESSAPSR